MLNFKNTKKILLLALVTPSIFLLAMVILSLASSPDIKIISSISLKDINTSKSFNGDLSEISETKYLQRPRIAFTGQNQSYN